MRKSVGIIGGGAAGMTAALSAAKQGAKVTVFEGNDRLGKKILSTGNGKCNLGNMDLGPGEYYTRNPELLQRYLEKFGTEDTISFFRELGLIVKQKNGYLYPVSEQASSVLDVLRFAIDRQAGNIQVMLQTRIERLECDKRNNRIRLWSDKQIESFDRVILTCGGKAAPKTGSDGMGYKLAGMLGHSLVPVVPALVQLKCREEWFKSISGVRAEAEISFQEEKQRVTERGELQLTEYGISGIPVFQISRRINYILRSQKEVEVKIDFLPDFPRDGFSEKMILERTPLIAKGVTVEEYFAGMLNKKLMNLFIRLAGLKPSDPVCTIPAERLMKVYESCRNLTVHVTGSNSFESAQVCAGGIPLTEITENLESKLVPGIFFAGELLDVDGRCGGYNLQWAWCSGYLAGMAAGK